MYSIHLTYNHGTTADHSADGPLHRQPKKVLGHPIEPLLRSECIASLRGEEHDGYIMIMIYM